MINQTILNNINKVWLLASNEDIQKGLTWYEDANKIGQGISDRTNTPLVNVIGVISAISPGVAWDTNVRQAEAFLLDENAVLSTYPAFRDKAAMIAVPFNSYDDIKSILLGNRGRGKKTANFFANMYDYQFNTNVTVDRWMYRAAKLDNNIKYYDQIEDVVRLIASSDGLLPHQVQATIWETIRRGV